VEVSALERQVACTDSNPYCHLVLRVTVSALDPLLNRYPGRQRVQCRVERAHRPITSPLDKDPAVDMQRLGHNLVVSTAQLISNHVTQTSALLSRRDHVGEQHR
jgi:hypothetical protein